MKKNATLNVNIDGICENITLNVKKMRLSKCIKHFDSKCVKIDAICANFITFSHLRVPHTITCSCITVELHKGTCLSLSLKTNDCHNDYPSPNK